MDGQEVVMSTKVDALVFWRAEDDGDLEPAAVGALTSRHKIQQSFVTPSSRRHLHFKLPLLLSSTLVPVPTWIFLSLPGRYCCCGPLCHRLNSPYERSTPSPCQASTSPTTIATRLSTPEVHPCPKLQALVRRLSDAFTIMELWYVCIVTGQFCYASGFLVM